MNHNKFKVGDHIILNDRAYSPLTGKNLANTRGIIINIIANKDKGIYDVEFPKGIKNYYKNGITVAFQFLQFFEDEMDFYHLTLLPDYLR